MEILEIARIVKYHRKIAGLSREELAKIAGVGKTVVFDLEKGKETIKLNTLLHILKTLNINIDLQSPLMKKYSEFRNEKS